MDAQTRRRVGVALPGAWVNGSKWAQKRHKAAGTGVNGSKWTHTKQMDAQTRRRVGMAPPGAWGKWLQMRSNSKWG